MPARRRYHHIAHNPFVDDESDDHGSMLVHMLASAMTSALNGQNEQHGHEEDHGNDNDDNDEDNHSREAADFSFHQETLDAKDQELLKNDPYSRGLSNGINSANSNNAEAFTQGSQSQLHAMMALAKKILAELFPGFDPFAFAKKYIEGWNSEQACTNKVFSIREQCDKMYGSTASLIAGSANLQNDQTENDHAKRKQAVRSGEMVVENDTAEETAILHPHEYINMIRGEKSFFNRDSLSLFIALCNQVVVNPSSSGAARNNNNNNNEASSSSSSTMQKEKRKSLDALAPLIAIQLFAIGRYFDFFEFADFGNLSFLAFNKPNTVCYFLTAYAALSLDYVTLAVEIFKNIKRDAFFDRQDENKWSSGEIYALANAIQQKYQAKKSEATAAASHSSSTNNNDNTSFVPPEFLSRYLKKKVTLAIGSLPSPLPSKISIGVIKFSPSSSPDSSSSSTSGSNVMSSDSSSATSPKFNVSFHETQLTISDVRALTSNSRAVPCLNAIGLPILCSVGPLDSNKYQSIVAQNNNNNNNNNKNLKNRDVRSILRPIIADPISGAWPLVSSSNHISFRYDEKIEAIEASATHNSNKGTVHAIFFVRKDLRDINSSDTYNYFRYSEFVLSELRKEQSVGFSSRSAGEMKKAASPGELGLFQHRHRSPLPDSLLFSKSQAETIFAPYLTKQAFNRVCEFYSSTSAPMINSPTNSVGPKTFFDGKFEYFGVSSNNGASGFAAGAASSFGFAGADSNFQLLLQNTAPKIRNLSRELQKLLAEVDATNSNNNNNLPARVLHLVTPTQSDESPSSFVFAQCIGQEFENQASAAYHLGESELTKIRELFKTLEENISNNSNNNNQKSSGSNTGSPNSTSAMHVSIIKATERRKNFQCEALAAADNAIMQCDEELKMLEAIENQIQPHKKSAQDFKKEKVAKLVNLLERQHEQENGLAAQMEIKLNLINGFPSQASKFSGLKQQIESLKRCIEMEKNKNY